MSAQTALFENMPAAVRGRVFGVLASIVSAASLLPILVAGPLADAISAPTVIAITAVARAVITAWSAFCSNPGHRQPLPRRARREARRNRDDQGRG